MKMTDSQLRVQRVSHCNCTTFVLATTLVFVFLDKQVRIFFAAFAHLSLDTSDHLDVESSEKYFTKAVNRNGK